MPDYDFPRPEVLAPESQAAPEGIDTYLDTLSAEPDLGHDVSELFNLLTGYSRQRKYRRLLVAPTGLRAGILDLIEREGKHPKGRIVMKVNNLVDQQIIDALYDACKGGAREYAQGEAVAANHPVPRRANGT